MFLNCNLLEIFLILMEHCHLCYLLIMFYIINHCLLFFFFEVEERKISIDEVIEAGKSGRMQECFGCGTAAVVSPVGELKYEDTVININNGEIGPITQKFYDTITGIQSGKVEDKFGWVTKVD